ncbi:MAG TPA: hypothetical protein VMW16_12275 [Sedimentisphaerales bacterium]|nr:hypothetical protein [Sedimentisphaerales bacterium]
MGELRLQEPRGTYKAQRLLASQEAEEFAEASRTKKCPELYLLYVYAANALKYAKSICLMSRRKERGSAQDFVLDEVRLAEYVDKLKDYPSLTDYLQEWPKNPGIVIAWFAGRSALEVIIKFTQAIRSDVVFGRGEAACHGATSYDILQVSPKCDLRFAEWQERAINELCEKTIPKPDVWPSPADIHKECQQVLLKLEDEYNKAEKEAENKAAETEQGADKKIYKGEEAWEKFEEKLSEFGSLEIPFYPFKAGKIKYWNLTGKSDICKYGAYRFSKEDSAIIKNTVGSTFNVSTLRAYLSAECNVQNPDNYSWKDILAALEHKLKAKTVSETQQDTKREQEGMIEAEPPVFLQNALWILKHGKKYWWLLIPAALVLLSWRILPTLNLFGKKNPDMSLEAKKSPDSNVYMEEKVRKLEEHVQKAIEMSAAPTLSLVPGVLTKNNSEHTRILWFKPSKNEPLGRITFEVIVMAGSGAKIIEFRCDPDVPCISERRKISQDGRQAQLSYSLVGFYYPRVELKTSDTCRLQVSGSHIPELLFIDIE